MTADFSGLCRRQLSLRLDRRVTLRTSAVGAGAVKFKPENACISTRGTVSKFLHNIIIKINTILKGLFLKDFF